MKEYLREQGADINWTQPCMERSTVLGNPQVLCSIYLLKSAMGQSH